MILKNHIQAMNTQNKYSSHALFSNMTILCTVLEFSTKSSECKSLGHNSLKFLDHTNHDMRAAFHKQYKDL